MKKSTKKSEPGLFELEFLLDTGASLSILKSPTWNAIKIHSHHPKYQEEKHSQTKLGTENKQLISINGRVELAVHLLEIIQHF